MKACPFCGGKTKYKSNRDSEGGHEPEIVCENETCGICFIFGYYGWGISPSKVFADVRKLWNNRHRSG